MRSQLIARPLRQRTPSPQIAHWGVLVGDVVTDDGSAPRRAAASSLEDLVAAPATPRAARLPLTARRCPDKCVHADGAMTIRHDGNGKCNAHAARPPRPQTQG
eukprot:3625819-Pyramimonas_sp.AAC.2